MRFGDARALVPNRDPTRPAAPSLRRGGLEGPTPYTRLAVRALEDQFARCLEGDAGVEVRGHRLVERIVRVLAVDHRRHPAHRLHDLLFRANTMVQPVSDVLA